VYFGLNFCLKTRFYFTAECVERPQILRPGACFHLPTFYYSANYFSNENMQPFLKQVFAESMVAWPTPKLIGEAIINEC